MNKSLMLQQVQRGDKATERKEWINEAPHLSFMMSPSTEAPRNTMCLRRGGSSTWIFTF